MPFVNLSAGQDSSLAGALADDITLALARHKQLQVFGPRLIAHGGTVARIRREFKLGSMLEGSLGRFPKRRV